MKKRKNKKKLNKIASLFDYQCFFYDFVKITGILPALLFLRMKSIFLNKITKKRLKKEPCIIVSNHNSFLDPLILLTTFYYKRIGIVATKELFNTRFKNRLFTSFGCIYVDKENVSIKTFKQVKERILRGHSVGIFPEGRIVHQQKEIDNFKSGVILMAFMANAPIYPVYIQKRKHWYKKQKVIIGNCFDVHQYLTTLSPSLQEIDLCCQKLYEEEKKLENFNR